MLKLFNRFAFLFLAAFVMSANPASAQATRTWVSGVGDDANPCSRTAPCKTFAGAISKTASGGEIDALDPGGYGAVTITKAITIDGDATLASILASGTNGINVSAGAGDTVILRNLSINGAGTGTNGINFLTGARLIVEHCFITGFTANGINAAPSTTNAQASVRDSTIENNVTGILLSTANATTVVSMAISRSIVAHNTGIGASALTPAGKPGALMGIDRLVTTHNGTGLAASGNNLSVLLGNSMVEFNGTGVSISNGATILTFQTNEINGNFTSNISGGTLTVNPLN
ncbi:MULTISPECIES: hypothetical protein [unclassified Bradyrhizobium]|uniref:hypothetical protein n=1 Tax=unclassified Bradyrhizobium TaxID=2631580 RepID=UPI0029162175|nr:MULTISPECIES: hypothetical protein [unclassified Bradyrhizobium]